MSARWEELLEDDDAGRRQRRRADLPARADHGRRAGARAARAVGEADRAHASRRRRRWSRPRARRGRVLDVAFNHRQRGDIQTLKADRRLGPARAALLREGVVAAADRDPDARAAGSRTPSRRAAGRCWTSACTCSTTRCSCSASRAVTAVSASTYDLLGTRRLRLRPEVGQDRRDRREDVRRRGSRDGRSCGSRTAGRCWSRRAGPRTARPATSSGSRSSAPRAAPSCGSRHGADRHAADLHRRGGRRRRDDAEPAAGRGPRRGRRAVPREGPQRRRTPTGATAAELARVVDACYRSAARAARGHAHFGVIVRRPLSGVQMSMTRCFLASSRPTVETSREVEPERGGSGRWRPPRR